jgi:hypothetical protein
VSGTSCHRLSSTLPRSSCRHSQTSPNREPRIGLEIDQRKTASVASARRRSSSGSKSRSLAAVSGGTRDSVYHEEALRCGSGTAETPAVPLLASLGGSVWSPRKEWWSGEGEWYHSATRSTTPINPDRHPAVGHLAVTPHRHGRKAGQVQNPRTIASRSHRSSASLE